MTVTQKKSIPHMLKLDMGKESSYTTKIGWKILLTQIKQLVILYI